MRAALIALCLLLAAPLGAQQKAFDVLDYDLTLDLPSAGKTIDGVAVLTVRRVASADTLVLDLLDMQASRVMVGAGAAAFRQGDGHVYVPVGGAVGDTLRVAVTYRGAPQDGLIIGDDSQGRWMAFGDNWPNRGRHWIPSVDHPSDKATVTWTVRAPSTLRVVANGRLVEETPLAVPRDPDGAAGRNVPRTLTRWRESRPIPVYLMVIAAAPLARYELGPTACGLTEFGGCVEQSVYAMPEFRDRLPGEFANAGDMVAYFARLVGPFGYEKLAHVQSRTRFGGMENASAIFYAYDLVPKSGRDVAQVIAHETAHQWFGDLVTGARWPDVWLSEGFATYFAASWLGHAYGPAAFTAEMRRDRAQIVASEKVAQRPVIDTIETNLLALLNANSYAKGGFVLHMLQHEVGDSAFFGGLRDYIAAHRHGNALTDDLRTAIEGRAKRPLGWFFDQWLRRPGFASLTTSWHFDAAAGRVVLDVEQGDRFGYFRAPLTVEVTDAAGAAHRVTVEVAAERTSRFVLPLPLRQAPANVVVDPDAELLAELRSR
ncbi:MAG: M1 family metallopeptidase [Gemmatimonadetes bacterium]|nr:M1 family metallopeptidase [Gemmatimonadota bacterium]